MLNATDSFTITSIDRAHISYRLNTLIQNEGNFIPEFETTDIRLTEELCNDIAQIIYVSLQYDTVEDRDDYFSVVTLKLLREIFCTVKEEPIPTEFQSSTEATEFFENLQHMIVDARLQHWLDDVDTNHGTKMGNIFAQLRQQLEVDVIDPLFSIE